MTTEHSLTWELHLGSVMSPMARALHTFPGLEVLQTRLLGFGWSLYWEDSQVSLTSYTFHLGCNSVSGSSDGKAYLRRSLLVARLSVLLMQISMRLCTREKPNTDSLRHPPPPPPISAINPDCFIFHKEFKAALGCMHTIHTKINTALNNYLHSPDAACSILYHSIS